MKWILKKKHKYYEIKVSIRDTHPPVWRRLQIPEGIIFHELNAIIQLAFDWCGYHAYDFEVGATLHEEGTFIELPELDNGWFSHEIRNSKKERIDKYFKEYKKMKYTYDFGDNWIHDITIEKIVETDIKLINPICIKAKMADLPEDCGGPWGYEELLEILQDPKHERFEVRNHCRNGNNMERLNVISDIASCFIQDNLTFTPSWNMKINLSDKPVTRAFKELRETNLIKEEKQGFGKPNLIYIGKIEHEELQNSNIDTNDYIGMDDVLVDNQIKEDYYIEENTIQETEYLRANKKDNIKHKNIDISQSEREAKNLEDIKQKCELYLLKESQRNIIENTLDLMFYSNNLRIVQAVLPQEIVRSRMQLLNASIIFYAFDKLNYLRQDSEIHNSTNFMISCLYNAITEYYSDSDLQFRIDYGSG